MIGDAAADASDAVTFVDPPFSPMLASESTMLSVGRTSLSRTDTATVSGDAASA